LIDLLPIRLELLLLIIAAGLYISDVAQFLFINEALFVRKPRGRWIAYLPSRGIEITRRFVVFPMLFEPNCATFRISWPVKKTEPDSSIDTVYAEINRKLKLLNPLSWISALLFFQIFFALPIVFVFFDFDFVIISSLIIIYAQVILACLLLVMRRKSIGIGWRKVGSIIFESLICLPYSINIYRKASLFSIHYEMDLLTIDHALLSSEALNEFRCDLVEIIDKQMAYADEDSSWFEALGKFRQRAKVQI
jgi:hypothetical protein